MEKTIPDSIRIVGSEYKVVHDDMLHTVGSLWDVGNTNHWRQEIRLDSTSQINDDLRWEVLLHEALHVISIRMGLELHESQVSGLSHGLHELLPQIIR